MKFTPKHIELTKVVFRVFKDQGDVIALFPYETGDHNGNCVSYQRIGHHGGADYKHCIQASRPATETEYAGLATELKKIGYNLKVIKRRANKAKGGI